MNIKLSLKLLTCFVLLAFLSGFLVLSEIVPLTSAQQTETDKTPPINLINEFDAAIQQRFLTEPNFGIRRIQPTYPTNPHINEYFEAKDGVERISVEAFTEANWKVGIHLFGRRITEIENSDPQKFNIGYRLHNPLAVTTNVKSEKLKNPKKMLDQLKIAFQELQFKDSYEFESGKWAYIARPVRAQESCLKCHNDYVITEMIGKNKYNFRKRQIGDVNGVLVYGFLKKG